MDAGSEGVKGLWPMEKSPINFLRPGQATEEWVSTRRRGREACDFLTVPIPTGLNWVWRQILRGSRSALGADRRPDCVIY